VNGDHDSDDDNDDAEANENVLTFITLEEAQTEDRGAEGEDGEVHGMVPRGR
jgi:hypothetical protein